MRTPAGSSLPILCCELTIAALSQRDSSRNYYEVLDAHETASRREIERLYRRLARKRHPDRGGSEEEMKVLNEAYAEASANGIRAVLLNFGGLEYMNSSGIGLLVTTLIRANRQGQKLLAYGLNEHYRHIFELTRLNEAIGVYSNESEALAAAKAA